MKKKKKPYLGNSQMTKSNWSVNGLASSKLKAIHVISLGSNNVSNISRHPQLRDIEAIGVAGAAAAAGVEAVPALPTGEPPDVP